MSENKSITERILTVSSKVISVVSVPFFIPVIAFIALFLFTYLRIMPIGYKLVVLGMVVSFTILLPILLIFLFLKISGAPTSNLGRRGRRYVPYLLTIISFIFCSLMMRRLNIPWYMNGIILSSILIMIVFLIANLRWKISAHAGGMGAIIGGLVTLANVFGYNPVWLLCIFIILAGLVGTSQMILGKHSLNEVLAGFTIGLICTIVVLYPTTSNIFFRYLF
ncbi:phosphatase PAP2 family protein [Bacteroides sp. 519]|uniref:phosphatase PAP2 family protein n=1 Tax=Bacteroides sp. 519 TaxID=2302937 RepID=UPI00351A841E